MALDVLITGANLDAAGNVKTALSLVPADIGGVRTFSENDPGAITGTPYLKSPETSPDYRIRAGIDTLLFNDCFNATTQNTNLWNYVLATLTCTQPGAGTVNFGTVQGTANTHGALMRTYQFFPIIGTAPLSVQFLVGVFTANLVADEIWMMGLGFPTVAGTPPTDSIYFKLTTAGWIGGMNYNGTVLETGVIWPTASIVLADLQKYTIVVDNQLIEFWRNDVLLETLAVPAASGNPFLQASLPVFMQKYCTGSVTNTNTIRVSTVNVTLMDIASNKPWPHQLAASGQIGYVGQNGHTQGKTSWWTNNTAPTAAAATNTAAIASATTLGGLVAVLPTLAASNDGILFAYQNPAATINISGRTLYITGCKVQGAVSVILAGGPVTYAYAIAHGHTAVSLATAETGSFVTATTHSPRICFVGMETYPVTAAVGTIGQSCSLVLSTPIVVRPGEFVALIARNLGVVTTTGAITIGCSFDAHWE